jgi:hypothetical protein
VIALKTGIVLALLVVSLVPAGCENLSILVDTGHGGYPLSDGRLSEFEDFASKKGFSVDFKDIETVKLHKYCLVLLVNPDSAFSQEDVHLLKEFVVDGGIVFLAGSGDFENRDHSTVTNAVLEALGSDMKFNDDQLTDNINCGRSYIPLFETWNSHPLTGSLPPISLYSPESVVCGERGYPLLQGNVTTKSGDTDGDGVTAPVQEILTLLAVERIGKGELLVGGSWDFFSGFSFQGHQEFVDQFLQYAARERASIPLYRDIFRGASIVVGEHCRPEVDRKGAETLSQLLQGTIEKKRLVIVGGPAVNQYFEEVNPYLPIRFEKDRSWYIARNDQKFYGQEYGIIAVVTLEDHTVLIAAGLSGTSTTGAVKILDKIEEYSLKLHYNAYGEAVLFKVSGDINFNGIEEESENWEIFIL